MTALIVWHGVTMRQHVFHRFFYPICGLVQGCIVVAVAQPAQHQSAGQNGGNRACYVLACNIGR